MKDEAGYEWTIEGRVQYVMFRDFTERVARKLGLLGYVRNNENGTVTVVAEGEREKLAKLRSYVEKGPLFAHVTAVREREIPPKGEYKNFEIRYN
jgi:acylphosphatase